MTSSIDYQTGIPSGFAKLNEMTAGWQPGDLVIVSGRNSVGKTAFAISMTLNMAKNYGCGVAFFSLEMSVQMLVKRMITSDKGIVTSEIRNCIDEGYGWDAVGDDTVKLHHLPVFIDDTHGLLVFDFREKCKWLVRQYGIRIAIIDYLQLMNKIHAKGDDRKQELSNITLLLKYIAKELNITVIALESLSRRYITDEDIAQNADILITIHRPNLYEMFEDCKAPHYLTPPNSVLPKTATAYWVM